MTRIIKRKISVFILSVWCLSAGLSVASEQNTPCGSMEDLTPTLTQNMTSAALPQKTAKMDPVGAETYYQKLKATEPQKAFEWLDTLIVQGLNWAAEEKLKELLQKSWHEDGGFKFFESLHVQRFFHKWLPEGNEPVSQLFYMKLLKGVYGPWDEMQMKPQPALARAFLETQQARRSAWALSLPRELLPKPDKVVHRTFEDFSTTLMKKY